MKIKSNYPPEFWLANEYLQEIGKFPLSVTDYFGSDCIGDAPRKGWCYDAMVWADSVLAPLYFPSSVVGDKLVRKYAWAIPTEAVLATVAKYSPLIEIGDGTGYWAYLLAKLGADIICYDTHVENTPPETIWYAIGAGNDAKVVEHSNRAIEEIRYGYCSSLCQGQDHRGGRCPCLLPKGYQGGYAASRYQTNSFKKKRDRR